MNFKKSPNLVTLDFRLLPSNQNLHKIIFPECKCSEIGSSKSDCNPESGKCDCKTGFSGQKCQVCPDGTLTNVTGCASGKKTLEICVVPKSH